MNAGWAKRNSMRSQSNRESICFERIACGLTKSRNMKQRPMKTGIAIFLLLGMSTNLSALGGGTSLDRAQPGHTDGILQSIENANLTQAGEDFLVTRKDARTPVEM